MPIKTPHTGLDIWATATAYVVGFRESDIDYEVAGEFATFAEACQAITAAKRLAKLAAIGCYPAGL